MAAASSCNPGFHLEAFAAVSGSVSTFQRHLCSIVIAMSRLESLPAEVLKLVMEHINTRERLLSCCMASKKLHAAAVAATQQVDLGELRHDSVQSGLHWISQYGQHVTSLSFGHYSQPVHELSCPNLLDLGMWTCSVQLGPTADGQPGVIQGCPKLTRLELDCNIIDAPDGAVVDSLSSLVHLQHLRVVPSHRTHSIGGFSSSTLPRLTHLTRLRVRCLSYENLAQLGSLTNLQQLHLFAAEHGTIGPTTVIGPGSAPGLTFPASLTRFETDSRVEAETLSLLPAGLKYLHMFDCVVEGPATGPGSMLSYLDRLQQLTRLELYLHSWPPVSPAYSALTASSGLVSLLSACHAILPASIWQHVFPTTRKLLHLTQLSFAAESLWNAADMTRLVSCCPNLCRVGGMYLHTGSYVSKLQDLTALTSMVVTYFAADLLGIGVSVKGLAALTQLRCLTVELHSQEHLQLSSLLPLTSLTSLTSMEWSGDHDELSIHFFQDGHVPDVWLQLLERCAADPNCQPTALRSLAHQLSDQKARSEQQAAELRAVVAHQQQQIACLEGQQKQQEQQLLAQQQVAAAQGSRIAALQGQLQQLLQRKP